MEIMMRLTKEKIENKLQHGFPLEWEENGKNSSITLLECRSRRLYMYLYEYVKKGNSELSSDATQELLKLYKENDLTPSALKLETTNILKDTWKLYSIETSNFGGLNSLGGKIFKYDFEGNSLLLEGSNGSGKSSFLSAILWAIKGDKPRDQATCKPEIMQPIHGKDISAIGSWPPLVSYPKTEDELLQNKFPKAYVLLRFQNLQDETATLTRIFENGEVTIICDPPDFSIPDIFIETGLLMPLRIAQIRLKGKDNYLIEIVKQLMGLDNLQKLGIFITGISRLNGPYLGYAEKEGLSKKENEFNRLVKSIQTKLHCSELEVPTFTSSDTQDENGVIAKLKSELSKKNDNLIGVIREYLDPELKIGSPDVYRKLQASIENAKESINQGLNTINIWEKFTGLDKVLSDEFEQLLKKAAYVARDELSKAEQAKNEVEKDSRFRLKVMAARWHKNTQHNSSDEINECPLCTQTLDKFPELKQELTFLEINSETAERSFEDNVNRIQFNLLKLLPDIFKQSLELYCKDTDINKLLIDALRKEWGENSRYANLTGLSTILDKKLKYAPSPTKEQERYKIDTVSDKETNLILTTLQQIENLVCLIKHFRTQHHLWISWWKSLSGIECLEVFSDDEQSLSSYLINLTTALEQASPVQAALDELREICELGEEITLIKKEQSQRLAIIDDLKPLKHLEKLIDHVAQRTIEELSSQVGKILSEMQLSENFQYVETTLERKEGILVRGQFSPNIHIDATLVANTSWLRSLLWAIFFALREEAVKQYGHDPFPIIIFDDPQISLDAGHCRQWANYVSSLQKNIKETQIILATHDKEFYERLITEGVQGREALIERVGIELAEAIILEGGKLDRLWTQALETKNNTIAHNFMSNLRIHIEHLLKIMLHAETPNSEKSVLGDSREKISRFHDKKMAPWNHTIFDKLAISLDRKKHKGIQYLENVHHTTGNNYGLSEAQEVHTHWKKNLQPTIRDAYSLLKGHRLLHGGFKALHAPIPSIELPNGYHQQISEFDLNIVGTASAITNGRTTDGNIQLEFETEKEKIKLWNHSGFRLIAQTMDPVAQIGDILITQNQDNISSPLEQNSFVIALYEDKIFARRYALSGNHNDIAVLTAQASNPNEIPPPIVAHKASFTLNKIIGVLFDYTKRQDISVLQTNGPEIQECNGDAELTTLSSQFYGLAKVKGSSAEPIALDNQYVILSSEVTDISSFQCWDGRPIVAVDSNDEHYFKRLRVQTDCIILESISSNALFEPIKLSLPGGKGLSLKSVWPVLGVIFEHT